jgi:hypothetical protein
MELPLAYQLLPPHIAGNMKLIFCLVSRQYFVDPDDTVCQKVNYYDLAVHLHFLCIMKRITSKQ